MVGIMVVCDLLKVALASTIVNFTKMTFGAGDYNISCAIFVHDSTGLLELLLLQIISLASSIRPISHSSKVQLQRGGS